MRMGYLTLIACVLVFLSATPAAGGRFAIDNLIAGGPPIVFTEMPFQTVHQPVPFQQGNVIFDFFLFGVPSFDAFLNASGPGVTAFVQDPSLEGNDFGVLWLQFVQPVLLIQFGVALNQTVPVPNGMTVALFDPNWGHLATTTHNLAPTGFVWAEALYQYTGQFGPVGYAAISFQVPEPATLLLAGFGLLAAWVLRRR